MKTIFDKVDPKYLECGTGVCDHVAHSSVLPMYIITVLLLVYITIKGVENVKSKR